MESKRDKNRRRIFLEYLGNMGGRINARRCPRWPRGRGRACPPGRAPDPRGPLVRRLLLFFGYKKANFWRKIWAKVSIQSELWISGYIRNGEREESQSTETERDRETDPISEGLSPLPFHGDQGPEGKPFSHLGRRSRKKKKKKGGPLSLSSGGARTPPGPSSSPQSTPTPLPSSPTSPSPSPIYLQWPTLPQPAVPST